MINRRLGRFCLRGNHVRHRGHGLEMSLQIDNYKHEFINFDFTIETKMKLLKLGHTYAKKFIKDMPRKICVAIINKIIDNVCDFI